MAKQRVVLTGAAGYLSQRMFGDFQQRYDLVPTDIRDTFRDGQKVPGVKLCDLTAMDRAPIRALFRGADCVVHNGFALRLGLGATEWQVNSEDKFRLEYQNVAMAYNVYQAALEEGVKRVVVSSSNHAADYYERLIWSERWDSVTPEMPTRSDNFYGWAKISYEALGFVYATGKVGGRKLEVVQLRIGGPRETDIDEIKPGEIQKLHRALGAYLSVRDQAQLYVRAVEAQGIEDENGVPFVIAYGTSGNTHGFWSLVSARKKLGYAPQDNSAIKFADQIARLMKG
jgi:nucleoside-diphosphate-sugar epimerase